MMQKFKLMKKKKENTNVKEVEDNPVEENRNEKIENNTDKTRQTREIENQHPMVENPEIKQEIYSTYTAYPMILDHCAEEWGGK